MKGGRNVFVCLILEEPLLPNYAVCYGTRDRAVIIVSALVNIGTEGCLCGDNLFFCAPEPVTTAKWRDVPEREHFSSRIVAISVDDAHCVSKW